MHLTCLLSLVGVQLPGSGLPRDAAARAFLLRDAAHGLIVMLPGR